MRAAWASPGTTGGRVELREVPIPVPGPGQVLVRVRAAGVNRGELVALAALRSGQGAAGGVECSGVVAEIGTGVDGWRPGDEVMAYARGSQAEYVCVDQRLLMRKPARLGWEQAAAFPNVFTTAHDALISNARAQAGESVLINAASSGIGVAALQIARWANASAVIGVSRSPKKVERLRLLGLTDAVIGTDDGFEDRVLSITSGRGVDVVIDCLGGDSLASNLRCMAVLGRLVSVGRLAGKYGSLDLDLLALRRLRLIGVTFRTRSAEETVACVQACARDLLTPLERGEIEPIVDRTFALERIADAHAYMASNEQIGKIVLRVT